jgi:hypothetical protein
MELTQRYRRSTKLPSTQPSSLDYAHRAPPKTRKSEYSGRSGVLKDKCINQQKIPTGNSGSHLSARLLRKFPVDSDDATDAVPINHRHERAVQPQTLAQHIGTRNNPHIIESDTESEVEESPQSQLKTGRERFASHAKRNVKEEPQDRYSSQRKRGQSRYCPPTSRKRGVKDVQEFIEDVTSDAESVETFHGTDTESEVEMSDLDEEELAEELDELNITMDDLGGNKKRRRSPNTDTDIDTETETETDTDVDACPQRSSTGNNPKRNKTVPFHSKRASKKSRFEFRPEPMDDEEDFFVLHAAKQRKAVVTSQVNSASRWNQKDLNTARNRPRRATSPSPTPSLLNCDVPTASVEPTDREVRHHSRKSKSVVQGAKS